jgi:cytoskeletal protein RodZ
MQFTKNMGTPDRIARFAIGALLIVLTLTGTIGVWGWIGIVPIATAALNFCPAYTLLGINTCGR